MSIAYDRRHEPRPGPDLHRRDRRRRAPDPRGRRAVRGDDAQRRRGGRRQGSIALQARSRSCGARCAPSPTASSPTCRARSHRPPRPTIRAPTCAPSPSSTGRSSVATRTATGFCSPTCRPGRMPDPAVLAGLGEPIVRAMARLAGESVALEGARTMVAWAHGFVTMELAGAFRLGGDLDAAYAFGIESILAGVSGRATPASRLRTKRTRGTPRPARAPRCPSDVPTARSRLPQAWSDRISGPVSLQHRRLDRTLRCARRTDRRSHGATVQSCGQAAPYRIVTVVRPPVGVAADLELAAGRRPGHVERCTCRPRADRREPTVV